MSSHINYGIIVIFSIIYLIGVQSIPAGIPVINLEKTSPLPVQYYTEEVIQSNEGKPSQILTKYDTSHLYFANFVNVSLILLIIL